jgi:hypothetical protein
MGPACQLQSWPPSPIGRMGRHLALPCAGRGIKPVGADRECLTSTPFGHHPPHLDAIRTCDTWRCLVLGVGIKPVRADRERLTSTPFGHHPPHLRSLESKLPLQLHPHFPCAAWPLLFGHGHRTRFLGQPHDRVSASATGPGTDWSSSHRLPSSPVVVPKPQCRGRALHTAPR